MGTHRTARTAIATATATVDAPTGSARRIGASDGDGRDPGQGRGAQRRLGPAATAARDRRGRSSSTATRRDDTVAVARAVRPDIVVVDRARPRQGRRDAHRDGLGHAATSSSRSTPTGAWTRRELDRYVARAHGRGPRQGLALRDATAGPTDISRVRRLRQRGACSALVNLALRRAPDRPLLRLLRRAALRAARRSTCARDGFEIETEMTVRALQRGPARRRGAELRAAAPLRQLAPERRRATAGACSSRCSPSACARACPRAVRRRPPADAVRAAWRCRCASRTRRRHRGRRLAARWAARDAVGVGRSSARTPSAAGPTSVRPSSRVRAQTAPPAEVIVVVDHNADAARPRGARRSSGVRAVAQRGRARALGRAQQRRSRRRAATSSPSSTTTPCADARLARATCSRPTTTRACSPSAARVRARAGSAGGRAAFPRGVRLGRRLHLPRACPRTPARCATSSARTCPSAATCSTRSAASARARPRRHRARRLRGDRAVPARAPALPGRDVLYEPRRRASHHRVPAERATWRYFRARCYAEGLSKAQVCAARRRRAARSPPSAPTSRGPLPRGGRRGRRRDAVRGHDPVALAAPARSLRR